MLFEPRHTQELTKKNYIQQSMVQLLSVNIVARGPTFNVGVLNWGCPADLLTNQTVLDPKVHRHTSRAPQVGMIRPSSVVHG
jgi:hypothetical protein